MCVFLFPSLAWYPVCSVHSIDESYFMIKVMNFSREGKT